MDKKEIRDILLGRIVRLDENLWGVAPSDAKFHFHGVKDGAGDVRLFGVTHLARDYQAMGVEPGTAFEEVGAALKSMGRPMQLGSAPEGMACRYEPGWIAPVLLMLEREENTLRLSAHTGRSLLMGKVRCYVSLWLLERRLPAGVTRMERVKKAGGKKTEKKESTPRPEKKNEVPKRKKYAPKRLKK